MIGGSFIVLALRILRIFPLSIVLGVERDESEL